MNILGMGPLEVLVIALIAFILLGPQRMVDAARLLGKATKEVRRMTDELPKIVLDEEQDQPPRASSTLNNQDTGEESVETDDAEVAADGPVAFRSGGSRSEGDKTQHTQGQDT
ncbi:MAG: twin-arginine translocase TatA/TatE family subunit [Chloroflexi bacterium]|nr:twin-arginine translocase TatA/TatE family subunit [Chloroflexota bacterium]